MRPWTYRDIAAAIGLHLLGEDEDGVAAVLDRSPEDIRRQFTAIESLVFGAMNAPAAAPKPSRRSVVKKEAPVAATPRPKPKYRPRTFHVSPLVRHLPRNGQGDVTAQLMGDPTAAAAERSLTNPASHRPPERKAKWS